MANPQPTDAHLRIAHSIEEQIMVSSFTEHELKILLFILRLSWGCGKHSAYIPRQRDFELIGIPEGHIKARLDYLIRSKVIVRHENYYEFNKDFDDWRINQSRSYIPKKLTDLVILNLNTADQKLTEYVSSNLQNMEVGTYTKCKVAEAEPASSKEILNKYINKENTYINIATGEEVQCEGAHPQEAGEIWARVLAELHSQVSAANYHAWLEKTVGLGYHHNDFIVSVPISLIAEHLNSHMRSLLEKTLIQDSGKPFHISFLVLSSLSPSSSRGAKRRGDLGGEVVEYS
jgi:hypothetical protein